MKDGCFSMSPYYNGKQTFSREEIIDILKRNVTLYKDGPGFAEYIATLSLYLVDTYHKESYKEAMKHRDSPIKVDTEGLGTTLKVSKGFVSAKKDLHCTICGTLCDAMDKNCPHCGSPM